jgi:hypothetical protein
MSNDAKRALKGLVRECLMEILTEGLGDGLNESVRSRSMVASKPVGPKAKQPVSKPSRPVANRLHETVAMVTDDELMRSILMDTAQTTLQEQLRSEIPSHAHGAVPMTTNQTDSGVDINDLFREASSSWNAISQRMDGKKVR